MRRLTSAEGIIVVALITLCCSTRVPKKNARFSESRVAQLTARTRNHFADSRKCVGEKFLHEAGSRYTDRRAMNKTAPRHRQTVKITSIVGTPQYFFVGKFFEFRINQTSKILKPKL